MIEMLEGSKFYYRGKLCEVVRNNKYNTCSDCIFANTGKKCDLSKTKCHSLFRHGHSNVIYREVIEEK